MFHDDLGKLTRSVNHESRCGLSELGQRIVR
jgi:hypothetical protein